MNALANLPMESGFSSLLFKALQGVRQVHPRAGLQQWARLLHVSEGQLQAARIGHEAIWPLRDVFSIFYQLSFLGEVEISTFNALGNTSHQGTFSTPDLCLDNPHQLGIQFLTPGLHLKLQLEHWYWGCATDRSLEFFSRNGQRFLSLRKTPHTHEGAWTDLLQQYSDQDICHQILFDQDTAATTTGHQPPENLSLMEQEWRNLATPAEIPALLERHQTTYFAALCSLGPRLARSVGLDSFEILLKAASKLQLPLRFSFFSNGSIQTGRQALIQLRQEERQRVLNWGQGNARLLPEHFEFAFVTRKPLGNGWTTALEIFGAEGELLLQLQGESLQGKPENLALREIFNSLL